MIWVAVIFYTYVFIVGACIGSFLNVVALRGLTEESIVFPASKCPVCNEKIKWYDNIPIFSYLFTFRGKCRACGCHVSLQYPIVETITAILFLLTFLFYGISFNTLLIWIMLSLAVVISITDIKEKAIFDKHLWWLIAFAVTYSVIFNDWKFALIGLISATIGMEVLSRVLYIFKSKDYDAEETTEEDVEVKNEEKTIIKDIHFYLCLILLFAYSWFIDLTLLQTTINAVVFLFIAKLSFFLINRGFDKFPRTTTEQKEEISQEKIEEEKEISEYVKNTKRTFGSGDTYVIAAAGALVGWKLAICVFLLAVLLQVIVIIPQFIKGLFTNYKNRLLTSMILLTIFAIFQFLMLGEILPTNPMVSSVIVFTMLYFALDVILRIRSTVLDLEVKSLPFAPALLIAMFITFFCQNNINDFLSMYF